MNNYCFSEKNVLLTVRCTPVIKWVNIPILRFGNKIEFSHLNAKVKDCKGTFIYNPPVDTIPISGGIQPFKVTFTPNDATIYDTVDLTIDMDVIPKLKPIITWKPLNVSYGEEITFINALNATCDQKGTWKFEGSGIIMLKDENGDRYGDGIFFCATFLFLICIFQFDLRAFSPLRFCLDYGAMVKLKTCHNKHYRHHHPTRPQGKENNSKHPLLHLTHAIIACSSLDKHLDLPPLPPPPPLPLPHHHPHSKVFLDLDLHVLLDSHPLIYGHDVIVSISCLIFLARNQRHLHNLMKLINYINPRVITLI